MGTKKGSGNDYNERNAEAWSKALNDMLDDPDVQPKKQKGSGLKALVAARAKDIRNAYDKGYSLEQIVTALRERAHATISVKTLRQYLAESGCKLRPDGKTDNTATHTTTHTDTKTTATETASKAKSQGKNSGGINVLEDIN